MKYKRTFIVFSLIVIIGVALIVINHRSTVYVLVKSTDINNIAMLHNVNETFFTISTKGDDSWITASILNTESISFDSKPVRKAILVDELVRQFTKEFYFGKWDKEVYFLKIDSTSHTVTAYKVSLSISIE
jgi:hypothetical protein